jgi:cytochrome c
MDLTFNKIAFCVLGTGLIMIGLNEVSHAFFHTEEHEKPGYFVEVPEAGTTMAAAAEEEGPRDYGVLIAAGDIEAGKQVAVKCLQCHSFDPGGAALQGPPLYGVVGRNIASVAGFKYSEGENGLAAKSAAVWNYEDLDHFLERPKGYAAGTAMNFVGLKKEKDRSDLLAYMRTLTAGEPLPLPAPLPVAAVAADPAAAVDPAAAPVDPAAPAPADPAAPAAPPPATPG